MVAFLFSVLMHTGYCRPTASPPHSAIQELRAVIRVLPPQDCKTKYSISAVADKGMKKPLYTSARLKKGEVLYLESHSCRCELCFSGEKIVKTVTAALANPTESERSSHYSNGTNAEKGSTECDNGRIDVFRWSRCKKPLPQQLMLSIGIPLPLENVEAGFGSMYSLEFGLCKEYEFFRALLATVLHWQDN
ncbi:hypothetical protein POM88_042760 [Heracleum sosnowskyi]|uniref:Uncharacterized protein n=1 Tax=Heracleum sosnowskyi TaxID=360622 RepID=A0AAD8HJ27_9APIA|nr:hypothetical protein POM88_042760 [Heracleum sosnowskyi]